MRKFLIAVLLAGAAATPALAQDSDEHGHHHNQQNNGDAHPQAPRGDNRANRPQFTPPQQQTPQFAHQPPVIVQQGNRGFERPQFVRPPQQVQAPQQPYVQRGYRGGFNGQVQQPEQVRNEDLNRQRGGWTGQRGNWDGQNGYYGQRQVVQQQYRQGNGYAYSGGGNWNRNWRNDHRYDWRRYRNEHRSIFQVGIYYDPFGYGYRPFDIGYQLMPVYYGQQYWLDPAMYDLPYPPPGAEWVRYWNDALLVDLYTGQVVDVIHGFFW